MPRSRKENAVYRYNRLDDHKALHNPRLSTFSMRYLHGARSHYPLTAQIARRYIQDQAGKTKRSIHDLKAAETATKKFLQSKQTKARFMNGKENTGFNS